MGLQPLTTLHLPDCCGFGGELCRFAYPIPQMREVLGTARTQAEKLKYWRGKAGSSCASIPLSYPEEKAIYGLGGRRPNRLHKMLFRLYHAWCVDDAQRRNNRRRAIASVD